MPSASRVLLHLNMETRALHPDADWPWLELMTLEASRARYLDHLVGIYGFEAPAAPFSITDIDSGLDAPGPPPLDPNDPDHLSKIKSGL